jgi:GNAT superfamily N-acetyltransferase
MIDATVSAFRGRVPDICLHWITYEESAANWARNFEPGGLEPDEFILIAEVGGSEVVGLAMVGLRKESLAKRVPATGNFSHDLYSLQVAPLWQRRGVGRRLVARAADRLLKHGVTNLLVRVLVENPNRAFYERLGARLIGSWPYDWEGYETQELVCGWDNLYKLRGDSL